MAEIPRTLTPPSGLPVMASEMPPPMRKERRWLSLPPDPRLVRETRDRALAVLAEAGVRETNVVESVRLVVSEAITNAFRAAERHSVMRGRPWEPYERPVGLRVECRPGWVHLLVFDPDPDEPDPEPRELLDEFGGRGFTIMDEFVALRWFNCGTYGKTLHLIVSREGVKLTPGDVTKLKQRVIM